MVTHSFPHTSSPKTLGLLCRQATWSSHHRAPRSAPDRRINLKLKGEGAKWEEEEGEEEPRGRAYWGNAVSSILSCYCKLSGKLDELKATSRKKKPD